MVRLFVVNYYRKIFILKQIIDFAVKHKLIHIVFWTWHASELSHLRQEELGVTFIGDLPDLITMVGSEMLSVYFTAYYLVPGYLDKRKYGLFVLYTLLTIIGTTAIHTILLEIYSFVTAGRFYSNFIITSFSQFIDTLFITPVVAAVITYSARYKIEEKNKSLEKEKVESELKFLRAQINPHFLFNALNSIHVLIDIDKQKASEALTKFSSLLRYNLYETKDNSVFVHAEIDYLKDYIEIEKLRAGKIVSVSLNISPANHYFKIAPFLFVPFIENAFKHVSRNKDCKNYINIKIAIEKDYIDFAVENSADTSIQKSDRKKGIGLSNVKRRLELLYPSRYDLSIHDNSDRYAVKLRVYANNDGLSYSRR